MKILGIVILYHPDDAAAGRIASYLPVLEKLLIWDNTPGGGQAARCIPPGTPREKCIVCGTGANEGIGRPLNEAVRRAAAEGCTHLMTFDQDSRFLPGEARRYVDRVAELEAGGEAVFSTNYLLESQGTASMGLRSIPKVSSRTGRDTRSTMSLAMSTEPLWFCPISPMI